MATGDPAASRPFFSIERSAFHHKRCPSHSLHTPKIHLHLKDFQPLCSDLQEASQYTDYEVSHYTDHEASQYTDHEATLYTDHEATQYTDHEAYTAAAVHQSRSDAVQPFKKRRSTTDHKASQYTNHEATLYTHLLGTSALVFLLLPLVFSCKTTKTKDEISQDYKYIIHKQLEHILPPIERISVVTCTRLPKNISDHLHTKLPKLMKDINASLGCPCASNQEAEQTARWPDTQSLQKKFCRLKRLLMTIQNAYEQHNSAQFEPVASVHPVGGARTLTEGDSQQYAGLVIHYSATLG
ncbi:hypothetical protein Baya_5410 [Bagarius yarrelli]|uniref:Uncharacterized protein n=1 Tax=Bagarius yarrelli TaxID=175774 RepID=A0A556TWT8_BAGYA|nr:hypothetical protein Baya_5410 [Bagarius yarrelli]